MENGFLPLARNCAITWRSGWLLVYLLMQFRVFRCFQSSDATSTSSVFTGSGVANALFTENVQKRVNTAVCSIHVEQRKVYGLPRRV